MRIKQEKRSPHNHKLSHKNMYCLFDSLFGSTIAFDLFLMMVIHVLIFTIYASLDSSLDVSTTTSSSLSNPKGSFFPFFFTKEPAFQNQSSSVATSTTTADSLYLSVVLVKEKQEDESKRSKVEKQDPKTKTTTMKKFSNAVVEPTYPKFSKVHYFPTHATENEMAKHDRYLVHGMLYTDMLTTEYIDKYWHSSLDTSRSSGGDGEQQQQHYPPPARMKKLCINIFSKNRSLPYVNALVMSLMGSHVDGEENNKYRSGVNIATGEKLLSFTELNMIDTERRSSRLVRHVDATRQKVLNLPFFRLHKMRDIDHQSSSSSGTSVTLEKIQDYIQAANVCIKSNLKWCLMMEEYTIVPREFIDLLQKHITAPLESYVTVHGGSQDGGDGVGGADINLKKEDDQLLSEKLPLLSLFTHHDFKSDTPMLLQSYDYSSSLLYDLDRAKLNSERKYLNMTAYQREYFLHQLGRSDGESSSDGDDGGSVHGTASGHAHSRNVALLFPMLTVKDKLLHFLHEKEEEEMKRILNNNDDHYTTTPPSPQTFDLVKEFLSYSNGIGEYYQIEPSMVNRIGFYDEDMYHYTHHHDHHNNDQQKFHELSSLGISNWITDPRFLFEAGEYYEGPDFYCYDKEGSLFEEEYYADDEYSTCLPRTEKSEDEKEEGEEDKVVEDREESEVEEVEDNESNSIDTEKGREDTGGKQKYFIKYYHADEDGNKEEE